MAKTTRSKSKSGKKRTVLKRRPTRISHGRKRNHKRQTTKVHPQHERHERIWNQRLKELKEYKEKHGNCNVPRRYQDNKSLGEWVSTQRKHYRLKEEGKYSTMSKARIDQLNAIGFVWKLPRGGKRV